ncbi:HNH endonuclease [Planctomicrobium sp. SH664]|uniref:HNH endonuclease n=1 Tax=Planctomicrobium sp. SH664 TaxID=3448125 RepID=UPI003F5BB618
MLSLALANPPDAVSADSPARGSGAASSAAMQANVLALNRNFLAVHVISVKRAFCLLCKGLAEVIHVEGGVYCAHSFESWKELSELKIALGEKPDHEDWIRSVNFDIQVPRVIRLLTYERVPRNTVKFNRRNIFLRDGHRCQYCGKRYSTPRLSLDHVMPKSRGGGDTWENIVCACLKCNVDKGGRTPAEAGMKLLQKPIKPKRSPLLSRQLTLSKYESWRNFINHSTD